MIVHCSTWIDICVFKSYFMNIFIFCNEILQVDRHYITNLFRPLTEEGHHQSLKHLLLSAVPQFFNEGDELCLNSVNLKSTFMHNGMILFSLTPCSAWYFRFSYILLDKHHPPTPILKKCLKLYPPQKEGSVVEFSAWICLHVKNSLTKLI